MTVAAGSSRHRATGDRIPSVPRLERAPGNEHAGDPDPVVGGGERADPLCGAVPVDAHRRQTADDRRARDRNAAVRRVIHDDGDVVGVAREPMLVVRQERSAVRRSDRDARAPIGGRGGSLRIALLLLEEQELALGRLQEGLELLESVDREELEDRNERSDGHALEDVHHVRVGGFRRHQIRREEVLELLG